MVQNEKVRPIDDFSEFWINMAFGLREKAQLKGMDEIVAWARARVAAVKENKTVEVC